MILSDALSRRADNEEQKEKSRITTLLPNQLFINLLDTEFSELLKKTKETEYDPSVLAKLRFLSEEPDAEDPDWTIQKNNGQPIIFYQGRKYAPNKPGLRRKILYQFHDHETAGHPGAATTYFHVSRDYWWPGITTYVKEYVKGCGKCQQNKINRQPWKGPLKPIPGPQDPRPFAQMSMDLMTDLPTSEDGYDTL